MIYYRSEPEGRLHQGEILSGLRQGALSVEALARGVLTVDFETHPFVVVVTQDCDLEQDQRARADGKPERGLRHVLFLSATDTVTFRATLTLSSEIWRRVSNNKDERYQVLERIPPEADALDEGIPALGVDFKLACFTMPTEEVLFRVRERSARLRARLATPWAEHLSARFAYYHTRIALPKDHDVKA